MFMANFIGSAFSFRSFSLAKSISNKCCLIETSTGELIKRSSPKVDLLINALVRNPNFGSGGRSLLERECLKSSERPILLENHFFPKHNEPHSPDSRAR
ncbi:hypothetical protein L1887_62305 [Cichorium endivia]|nr:hypothetical protein L1887_62305 [Cichorium endivia]